MDCTKKSGERGDNMSQFITLPTMSRIFVFASLAALTNGCNSNKSDSSTSSPTSLASPVYQSLSLNGTFHSQTAFLGESPASTPDGIFAAGGLAVVADASGMTVLSLNQPSVLLGRVAFPTQQTEPGGSTDKFPQPSRLVINNTNPKLCLSFDSDGTTFDLDLTTPTQPAIIEDISCLKATPYAPAAVPNWSGFAFMTAASNTSPSIQPSGYAFGMGYQYSQAGVLAQWVSTKSFVYQLYDMGDPAHPSTNPKLITRFTLAPMPFTIPGADPNVASAIDSRLRLGQTHLAYLSDNTLYVLKLNGDAEPTQFQPAVLDFDATSVSFDQEEKNVIVNDSNNISVFQLP